MRKFGYIRRKANKSMANHSEVSPMMTIGEVARFLSVHENTVRRWSNRGILRPYHLGKRRDRRFVREDVDSFLCELTRSNGDERKAQTGRRPY